MEINIHETKNATPLDNGSAVPRGTARNVNAPVEIAGFDFSGTARRLNATLSVGRPQFNVHTDERTQVYGTRSFLVVTHPGTNRGRRCLTSVNELLS
jgi:hypothetical protein